MRQWHGFGRRPWLPAVVLLCALAAAAAAAPLAGPQPLSEPPVGPIGRSCGDDNPYFAVTRLTQGAGSHPGAAVVAFYDTPDDDARQQLALAHVDDVGAVFGAAYDWRRAQLYVAAYHRLNAPLGPGGPGQIYRVDLYSGAVTPFARLDAGPDRHGDGGPGGGGAWVGATGLGDIDVDETGAELLVVNLHDRRVHRLRLPDGAFLGAFPTGGADRPWADRARPFGLGAWGGWIYHGVVELPSHDTLAPVAHLFRSRRDGSSMTAVARVDLGYERQPRWGPWSEYGDGPRGEPMLVDVAFRPDGTPILGLRDRRADAARRLGGGDVLPLAGGDGAWTGAGAPGHYQDQFVFPESLLGGLAAFPDADILVGAATAPLVPDSAGAVWFDNASGQAIVLETVALGAAGGADTTGALGDVEPLCGPRGAPTLAPSPTATARPTPTVTPAPAYLPLSLRESCPQRHLDIVLAIDLSTSMNGLTTDGRRKVEAAAQAAAHLLDMLDLVSGDDGPADRAGLVGFHSTAWTVTAVTGDRPALDRGLAGLGRALGPGSRLDLALERAAGALAADGRPDGVTAVVLLSDGLPTGVPAAEDGGVAATVLRAAETVRRLGARLVAIGFGLPGELDEELLTAVAGGPSQYRSTPDARELAEIFGRLVGEVRCPPGRHRWGEPWP